EADEAHLVEHASDPLTSLLGDSEVRADACDRWIARVSGDVQGIGRFSQPGEAAGARDLVSCGVDAHAEVIPGTRITAVHNRIDESLEPGILGYERQIGEPSAGTQRMSLRHRGLDAICGVVDDARDRPLEARIHA